jgi:hypothetical protein
MLKFIFTVFLLTILFRQRHRILGVIRHLILAVDAVHTAWKNM